MTVFKKKIMKRSVYGPNKKGPNTYKKLTELRGKKMDSDILEEAVNEGALINTCYLC